MTAMNRALDAIAEKNAEIERLRARVERLGAVETAARTFLNEQTDENAAALGAALAGKLHPHLA